jgi:hypothetical protein
MRYIALIYTSEATEPVQGSPEHVKQHADYGTYTQALQSAGVMRGGAALQPISTATTVRVRDGKTLTTDGPFAETKEQLGGFYIFDCANLDQAIEWAAKIPGAARGSVEVRPEFETGG